MKNNAKYFRWAGTLICCIFVISCGYYPADVAVQFDRNTFNREKALWEAQQLTDYVFTEAYFPDYPAGNARITVAGNKAVSIEPLESEGDNTLFGETIADIYERIEENVAYWEEQLRTNSSPYDAVNFIISYDEDYHFPKSVQFSIVEPGLMGGWYDVTIRDFVTAEAASQKQENFDMAAFWQEKKLWEEQHIESYIFTQTHESNFIKAPATVSFRVAASGCTPVSGNENDMQLCYGGSISLIYSRILSEFEYWRSEMYKNDDYASIDCSISYNAVWHYPESVRFRIGLASGDAVRWESLDIVEFEEVE